jgi:hypothetical protein
MVIIINDNYFNILFNHHFKYIEVITQILNHNFIISFRIN